jgi:hypothetical protein
MVGSTELRNDGLSSKLPVGSSSQLQGNPQASGEEPFLAAEPPGFVGQIATSDQAQGLRARLAARVALHNFCVWLNEQLGRPRPAFADLLGW